MKMMILFSIYIFIALFQVPSLIKKREWRDLTVFFVCYIIAFTLGLLYVLDVKMPSPYEGARILVEDILHLKY